MMGFKICSLTYKFKVRVGVRSVKEPYGGARGLASWVRVRFRSNIALKQIFNLNSNSTFKSSSTKLSQHFIISIIGKI